MSSVRPKATVAAVIDALTIPCRHRCSSAVGGAVNRVVRWAISRFIIYSRGVYPMTLDVTRIYWHD
jgi:hypothetical protein